MKKIFTLVVTLVFCSVSFSQSLTSTGTTATSVNAGGRAWSINTTTQQATATNLNNGQSTTDNLVITGFNFAALPVNISVQSITISFSRAGEATIQDLGISLILANGTLIDNQATTTNWPATSTSVSYTFPTASVNALTQADIQNAGFGVSISAQKTAGNNITATVDYAVTMTVNYATVAPLILTDFSISKNADNHVNIRFSTATEDRVKYIYVERSADGKTFEKLFTITPKGARNVYTSYAVTDKTPLMGNNYYRLTEVDLDGRYYYYDTKLITITRKSAMFNAYYNGGQVIANISNIPGIYEVSLVDMSGVTISRKQVKMNGSSAQTIFDAPSRPGVYLVILKGDGVSETTRVSIVK